MRFLEFRKPLKEAKVGRNLQHLEDLVFVDGSEGALEALDILSGFEKDVGDVSIKWDGCIHPNSIVETSLGKMRIEDVIDTINDSLKEVSVLQFNFKSQTAEMLPVMYAVKKYGAKNWVQVELDNGDTLILTEDHEVYTTNRGWVAAGKLTEDDDIKDITK
jgi:intein/homing endonuclease